MAMMDGLASYEIYKTGFCIIIIICCFCSTVGLTIYNMNKNYVSTTICTIKNLANFEQSVSYTVNNVVYTKNIPAKVTTVNGVSNTNYAYPEGQCTLYYASANPNDFSVNANPTVITQILSIVLCVIGILAILWLLFLQSHRDLAGVMGGIDAGQSILGSRR